MPELLSAALFERDGLVLAARRKPGRPPFAARWLLPLTVVSEHEAAEEALRRHAREQFGIEISDEAFVDTVYLEDPDDALRYVANIFRAGMHTGPMRFNADGDYDDARWLAAGEIAQVSMPPPLCDALLRILEGGAAAETDWDTAGAAGGGVPLAERPEEHGPAPAVADEPPPDNRASWDAIARTYQAEKYGDRYPGRFMWSWGIAEDDVRLLDDVRARRVLVLGCGGGQDVVALSLMGAVAVGIDESKEQLAYAREYATRHHVENAAFVEGTAEDLSRFDDASFHAVVSSHVLNYVERIEAAVAEAARVLKPGGAFALSVRHPFDTTLSEAAPYCVEVPYWQAQQDWTWSLGAEEGARFRQRFWPIERWFALLTDAGLIVERLIEPREEMPLHDELDAARARLVPHTLLMKARKR
ncbi:MAG: methyltransferase domain-containing protein [Dehalococcoidia bacterium]|nr:methyltransferase domain-containing protein [Dehalococcoidia bacterium]